MNYAVR